VESTTTWSDSRRVSIEGSSLCSMSASPSPPTRTSSQVRPPSSSRVFNALIAILIHINNFTLFMIMHNISYFIYDNAQYDIQGYKNRYFIFVCVSQFTVKKKTGKIKVNK